MFPAKNRSSIFKVFAIAVGLACGKTAGREAAPEEIRSSIAKLASVDSVELKNAATQLSSVRSGEGIATILHATESASPAVRSELFNVLGAIGEPAAEMVFAGSINDPMTGREKSKYASDILTDHLKLTAIPFLKKKLLEGEDAERKVAAWAIWYIVYYNNRSELEDPIGLISCLMKAATGDRLDYVRKYSTDALCKIRNDACIPALIELLSEPKLCVQACSGLALFGESAGAAVEVLKKGIEQRKFPVEAIDALIATQGESAVPFVIGTLATWPFKELDRYNIARALVRHPHPAAIPFMEEELWHGRDSSRGEAAQFFCALENPASVTNLRKCLSVYAEEEMSTPNISRGYRSSWQSQIRTMAVLYLGTHRDTVSCGTIQLMLLNDPERIVRIVAAKALGDIGSVDSIPALMASFNRSDAADKGISSRVPGLHDSAVEALAKIGTPDALAAIYHGLQLPGTPQRACSRFLIDTKDRGIFESFLEFYRKESLDDKISAGIVAAHLFGYPMPDGEIADAKKRFVESVRDPKHFGPGVDLSDAGKWQLEIEFSFFTIEFATVSFTYGSPRRECHGRSETVLYKKLGSEWLPMRTVDGWVE